MLDPRNNRIDYGEQLKPPAGFQLSTAVATTYTLDLETVLALPIAMRFNTTLEGNLQGENMALLEAISDIKDRFRVFFQQGNIHLPQQFNRLFTLLEPCLVPVTPDSAYSAFHPKIWLMRFISETDENDICYRLIVLTRNLTFDTSWDVAVSLNGSMNEGASQAPETHYRGTLDLLEQLPLAEGDESFVDKMATLRSELPQVHWDLPNGFKEMETRAGIPGKQTPLVINGNLDELLVMSPFLHAGALRRMDDSAHKKHLFSEPGALDDIGAADLEGWHCFALNNQVQELPDHEEATQDRINTASALHAKLFIARKGRHTDWYLGSANATAAALGVEGNGNSVQNTEFMLKLSTTWGSRAPAWVKETLAGPDDKPTEIFVPHEFSAQTEPEEVARERLRRFLHQLTQAQWLVTAIPQRDGYYHCRVSVQGLTTSWQPEVKQIDVGLLAQNHYVPYSNEGMEWTSVALTQLSRFVPINIWMTDGTREKLLIKADLEFEGTEDPRVRQIFHEVLHDQTHFMAYIRMLLAPSHEQSHWLHTPDTTDAESQAQAVLQQLTEGPVFESLLLSSGRSPEKLTRIAEVVERLEAADATCIPPSFKKLWEHFRPFAKRKEAAK